MEVFDSVGLEDIKTCSVVPYRKAAPKAYLEPVKHVRWSIFRKYLMAFSG